MWRISPISVALVAVAPRVAVGQPTSGPSLVYLSREERLSTGLILGVVVAVPSDGARLVDIERSVRVVEIPAAAGRLTAPQRAETIANRLNDLGKTDQDWWRRIETARAYPRWNGELCSRAEDVVVVSPPGTAPAVWPPPGSTLITRLDTSAEAPLIATADAGWARQWGAPAGELAATIGQMIKHAMTLGLVSGRDPGFVDTADDMRPTERAILFRQRGDAYWAAGQTDKAEERYRMALKADPRHAPAYVHLAGMLMRLNRVTEARALAAEARSKCGGAITKEDAEAIGRFSSP